VQTGQHQSSTPAIRAAQPRTTMARCSNIIHPSASDRAWPPRRICPVHRKVQVSVRVDVAAHPAHRRCTPPSTLHDSVANECRLNAKAARGHGAQGSRGEVKGKKGAGSILHVRPHLAPATYQKTENTAHMSGACTAQQECPAQLRACAAPAEHRNYESCEAGPADSCQSC
jgi:hypothetical protein